MVLLIVHVLYKVVLTFEFMDEILKCDHSNKRVCYTVEGGEKFESVDEILKCDHSNENYTC